MGTKPLRIAFLHPDLGIGGAERLIVDAAYGLQQRGHSVVVYTSHYDPTRAFDETLALRIHVMGQFLPRNILGFGHVVMAILKSLLLALVVFFRRYDVIVVDQLSAPIPLLRLTGSKIVFYCHFPDKLLAGKSSVLKTLYRMPMDLLEELTTGNAC